MELLKYIFSNSYKRKGVRFLKDIKNNSLVPKRFAKRVLMVICCVAVCVFNSIQTLALEVHQEVDFDKSINSGEFEGFIDDSFNKSMKEYNIPGAVISVVKGGKVIFSKGYGYADVEKKIPVNPNKTLFRIGSVTKLFTANAAMQLVEEGRIDLNEDVNKYVNGIKIKSNYNTKVTLAQLLTHTSGIDSDVIGDLSEKEPESKMVSEVLEKRMLPVVRQPGEYIQYSSYGMALAGGIVEEVSGMNCAEYINKNIFYPLGMMNTSFNINSPELAKGYVSTSGKLEMRELKGYFNLYPVGGILSTADDMAKYMIAHLNNGEYNGNRILKEDMAIEMHSRHAGFDPVLPGTCYGFCEKSINGQRIIGHDGYSPDGFSTELSLLTDHNIGIFVSINQGSNNSFPQEFTDKFIEHYSAYFEQIRIDKTESDSMSPEFNLDGGVDKAQFKGSIDKNIEGTYRFGDYTRSTLNKGDLFGVGADVTVSVYEDGRIVINETDPFTGEKSVSNAQQVAQMVFKKEDGSYVVFKKDNKGKISYMAQTSDSWHGTYERISWYDENSFQIGLFTAGIIILLFECILCLVFCIRSFVNRSKSKKHSLKIVKFLSLLSGLNSLLNIMYFAISMMTWGERLRYGMPLDAELLLLIPIITTIMSAVLFIGSIIVWNKKAGSLLFRVNTSAAAATGLVFVWIYSYWNMLGFKY